MDKLVILLVGAQGSGKTTYCRRQLPHYVRISQDEQGRQGHWAAFEEALQRGEPWIVVDRINALKIQRQRYLAQAKQHGYTTRIVWFNTDPNLCLRRCRERTDHPTLKPEDADKAVQLFFRLFQIPSRCEANSLTIVGPPPVDVPVEEISSRIGSPRHTIRGDVHGC